MINQVVIVGRITSDIRLSGLVSEITLEVSRNNKKSSNKPSADYIPCVISEYLVEKMADLCEPGDLIGVKGHLEASYPSTGVKLIAEKVTFLSSKTNGKGGDE